MSDTLLRESAAPRTTDDELDNVKEETMKDLAGNKFVPTETVYGTPSPWSEPTIISLLRRAMHKLREFEGEYPTLDLEVSNLADEIEQITQAAGESAATPAYTGKAGTESGREGGRPSTPTPIKDGHAPPTGAVSADGVATEKPRRWADQYDFDKSDPATRLFVAASNWMDRAERAEEELQRVKVERGELALKLAGAQCFIEEQRKKGSIK